MHIFN